MVSVGGVVVSDPYLSAAVCIVPEVDAAASVVVSSVESAVVVTSLRVGRTSHVTPKIGCSDG